MATAPRTIIITTAIPSANAGGKVAVKRSFPLAVSSTNITTPICAIATIPTQNKIIPSPTYFDINSEAAYRNTSSPDLDSLCGSDTGYDEPMRKRQRLTHLSPDEKQNRRKLRNRIAAQAARDRKKAFMEDLMERVSRLEKENKKLAADNAHLRSETRELHAENRKLKAEMAEMKQQKPAEVPTTFESAAGAGGRDECGVLFKDGEVSIDDILRSLHEIDAGGTWAAIGDAEVYSGAVDGAIGERENYCDPSMLERTDQSTVGIEEGGAAGGESEAPATASTGARLNSAGAFFDAMNDDDQKPTISVHVAPDDNDQCAQSSSPLCKEAEEIVNPAAADENLLAPPPTYFSHTVPHSPVLGSASELFDAASFDQCLLETPPFDKPQELFSFDASMNDLLDGVSSDFELKCMDNWEELFPTLLI